MADVLVSGLIEQRGTAVAYDQVNHEIEMPIPSFLPESSVQMASHL